MIALAKLTSNPNAYAVKVDGELTGTLFVIGDGVVFPVYWLTPDEGETDGNWNSIDGFPEFVKGHVEEEERKRLAPETTNPCPDHVVVEESALWPSWRLTLH